MGYKLDSMERERRQNCVANGRLGKRTNCDGEAEMVVVGGGSSSKQSQ